MIASEIQAGVRTHLGASLLDKKETGNSVISFGTGTADYALGPERLALVCAWGGRQEVLIDSRRVLVDDDTWLAVPAGSPSVRVRGSESMQAMTLLFRAGLPQEVLGALLTPEDRMLDGADADEANGVPFLPHLQPHDRSVTPVLLFIRRHTQMGLQDSVWYEEQMAFLLERMLLRHRHVMQRARSVPVRRSATRREILRRISLATDFIHSNYDKPLMLGDMARAAFLSRHHFLRLFKHVHEVTPHEYLQRKRTSVAARLLRDSGLSVEEVVRQVGFDSRSTLFRAMRRFHGVTPRECRQHGGSFSLMTESAVA
jgi:AraC family transcriptional regulator